MTAFNSKTNGEPLKCVNCGNEDFHTSDFGEFQAYECTRCHFVSLFGKDYAPVEADS